MKKFMIAALAAGMLTACSDSAVVEAPANGGAQWGADGTGYVSLSINLPKTTSVGRDNDQFNDGLASEWAVNDAILVLFTKGATDAEGDYQYQAAYQLPVNFGKQDPEHDQITATAQITKRIEAIDDDHIKALVILNGISSGAFKCANGVDVDDKEHASLKYIDETDTEKDVTVGTKFSDFQGYTSKISTDASKGLLMMNAPLSNAKSETGDLTFNALTNKVTTLSEIISDNIKNTASEAAKAPAANIYVERAVAKVTMNSTTATGSIADCGFAYTVDGIALDNTNPTSYLVRNANLITSTLMAYRSAAQDVKSSPTGYRMIGNSSVGFDQPGSSNNLYRTYFATSTNYTGAASLYTKTTTNPLASDPYVWTTPANTATYPLYCLENTFDVDHMTFHNTTRAVLKVKIGSETGDRYILHNWDNNANTWCDLDEMKTKVLENIQAMAVYQGKTISEVVLKEKSGIENVLVLESYKVGDDVTNSGTDFETAKNRIGDVYKYVDGYAYYEVRIKHFGDDLTPWNGLGTKKEWTTEPKEGSISTIYPDPQAQNYLGRYGVLRNNWYELKITKVKRIGTPYIPAVAGVDTPDDVINSYISVNINILSWAKREQGVELQ